jgi:hypothetical protein
MTSSRAVAEIEQSPANAFLAGWGRAAVEAIVAAFLVAAVAVGAMLLLRAAHPLPGMSTADALRQGWTLFYVFHHTGIEVISPSFHLPQGAETVAGVPSGYDVDATIAFAAMTGTVLVGWLLYRAGRATANAAGGEPFQRALHGAKVALPYALLAYVPSWWLHIRVQIPGASPMSIHPSHLASLFWPLALAAVMGTIGGVRSAWEEAWASDWWESDRWSRRLRGALAGGWRMAWVGLGLSLVALIGLALARPGDTAAYFDAISAHGVVAAAALALLTALLLPNMAAWILMPAMGGCLEVGGASSTPFCFLSFGAYPGHQLGGPPNPSGFPNLGSAPPVFLLFALVPVAAVILGGIRAARRGEARSPGDAAVLGALAGVAFAVIMFSVFVLSSILAVFNGPIYYVATGYFRYGPNPASGFQLALVWGALGGALGGRIGYRRQLRPSA